MAALAFIVIATSQARAQEVFVATGSLNEGRYEHAAAQLADGRVLVVGGWGMPTLGSFTALSSAETYDPLTDTWTLTGSMAEMRIGPAAAVLPSGRVLVAGGYGPIPQGGYGPLSTAEIYDPASGSFSPVGAMSQPRWGAAIGLLPDGRVLVAGGNDQFFGWSNTAEIFDPATGTFSPTGIMPQGRNRDAVAQLPNGDLLLAGGCFCSPLRYDATTGTFTPTSPMLADRPYSTATTVDDGRVLVAGGYDASGELFDSATGLFSYAGAMVQFRSSHTATLLTSGHVLLAGGNGPLDSAELFDTAAGFAPTAALHTARTAHTATRLLDGRVLLAGGVGSWAPLQSSELFYESGYVDTVAPVITVPSDITVGAWDAGGIVVSYTVSGTDNVDKIVTVLCSPASDSIFPVGTTTVACSATDQAGNIGENSFQVIVLPPFELSLQLSSSSVVNPVSGVTTISGTVSCNRDASGFVSGTVTQLIANRAVVSAFFSAEIACTAPGPSKWTATASPAPSRFKAGKATVSLYGGACNVTCDSESIEATVKLIGH
jgi:hypothetical protein